MILQRVYKAVSVRPDADGYDIWLDDKLLHTPAGVALRLPTLTLAEAIAAEWQAQKKTIDLRLMPLFRLAATALDRVATEGDEVVDRLVAYGATDLLCYRVATPAELARRQAEAYQPALDWLAAQFGVSLAVTAELQGLEQPAAAFGNLRAAIVGRDCFALAGLQALTVDLGSVALALSVVEGAVSAEAALAISLTEETYQNERWGADAAALARRQRLREDVTAAGRFLALIPPRSPGS